MSQPTLLTGTLQTRGEGGGVIRGDDMAEYAFDDRDLSVEVDACRLVIGDRLIFRIRRGLARRRAVQVRKASPTRSSVPPGRRTV